MRYGYCMSIPIKYSMHMTIIRSVPVVVYDTIFAYVWLLCEFICIIFNVIVDMNMAELGIAGVGLR